MRKKENGNCIAGLTETLTADKVMLNVRDGASPLTQSLLGHDSIAIL